MSQGSRQHHVAILALDRVVAFDLAIAAQILGHPAEELYETRICGQQRGHVPTTTGFSLDVWFDTEVLDTAGTIVIPGFAAERGLTPLTRVKLRKAARNGARIVSICTGAFALAEAGLLDGRRCTTHWQDAGRLARRYPEVTVDPDVLFVQDGNVWTSAGVAAGIDLCLHLVREDHGTEAANAVARRMVVAPLRDGGQAQFVARPAGDGHGGLAATRAWMLERLAEPLTVADCARHAGWSERSFARRFQAESGTSALRWLHVQRVQEARRLLESGPELTVEEIAQRCGFGTATTLRGHFRRATAMTPTAYRRAWLAPTPVG